MHYRGPTRPPKLGARPDKPQPSVSRPAWYQGHSPYDSAIIGGPSGMGECLGANRPNDVLQDGVQSTKPSPPHRPIR